MAPSASLRQSAPPFSRKWLDDEIAVAQARTRRRRFFAFMAFAAVVAATYYYGRDRLGAVASTAFKQPTATLRATGKRDGIRLLVDGKEIGTLPQEVKQLTPGEHSLIFEGGDRYVSEKSTVNLEADQTTLLDRVSLRVSRGAATFDVKTPGTSLALISTDERRALTDYSHPIDIDNSKSWTLEATKLGFKTLMMPITFEDDAEKTFVIALTERTKGIEVAAQEVISDMPAPRASRLSRAEPAPRQGAAAPALRPAPVAAASPATAEGGTCTLNINSIPTSHITLDGRAVGVTPKVGISVPSGQHSVMLTTDSGRKVTSASCRPGEVKTIAVRIAQ